MAEVKLLIEILAYIDFKKDGLFVSIVGHFDMIWEEMKLTQG